MTVTTYYSPENIQRLTAILDRTCDELHIDKQSAFARSAREFLGQSLIDSRDDAMLPVEALR